jgi:hypothetical protein
MECCISKALLTFLLLSAYAQVFDEKVANVSLAFELMMDGGLPQPKARPEDIVNLDLKSTLRLEINTFLGDGDPLVRGMDPDPDHHAKIVKKP